MCVSFWILYFLLSLDIITYTYFGKTVSNQQLLTENQERSPQKNEMPITLRIRAATATALGAAAANAKLLADQEDREIEQLVATIIETQVGKFYSVPVLTCSSILLNLQFKWLLTI